MNYFVLNIIKKYFKHHKNTYIYININIFSATKNKMKPKLFE